jgi:hypothetical protein
MLIKLTRVQGDEQSELWINSDQILMFNRTQAGSQAKTVIQMVGYASNIFVAESPEEVIGLTTG